MSELLTSVVVPNYNYARFLPASIGSAAQQTYQPIELIVVDDASSDESTAVLQQLREEYQDRFGGQFRILRHAQNAGAHAAINDGIQAARGRFVTILNADDLFEEDRLAELHAVAQRSGARFVFSGVRCIDRDGKPLDDEFARKMHSLPLTAEQHLFVALAAVAENVAVSTGNMFFEKDLWSELGGFRGYRYVHDYDFLFRACLACEPAFAADTDYLYRIHGDNTFSKLQEIGIAENRLVWLEMYSAVQSGRVRNPRILDHPDYADLFRAAADAYGFQKKVMWRIAGTRIGDAVAAVMRTKLRKHNRSTKNAPEN